MPSFQSGSHTLQVFEGQRRREKLLSRSLNSTTLSAPRIVRSDASHAAIIETNDTIVIMIARVLLPIHDKADKQHEEIIYEGVPIHADVG